MPTTTTTVGKAKLVHPDLGYDPGSGLHTAIRTLYTTLANQVNTFWSGSQTVANTGTLTVTHNLATALTSLNVRIFESGAPISLAAQLSGYTIAQTDTNTITVQNNTGSSKTIEVYVVPLWFVGDAQFSGTLSVSKLASGTLPSGVTIGDANVATFFGPTKGGTGQSTYATGDLLYASAANILAKRTIGTVNQVLKVDSTGVPVWGQGASSVTNYLLTYADASTPVGTIQTLGSGTANLTSTTQFAADSTSGASAIAQSTDSSLRGTQNYLTALSGAALAGTTFVQLAPFALEGTDLGKPVTIQFDITSSLADGDWDVVVVRYNSSGTHQSLIPVAGNASSATATPSAKLPTGRTTFRGFFVPDASNASDIYALRFRRLVGSQQIRIDTLFVGPQTLQSGTAVTDWASYTPSLVNETGSAITLNATGADAISGFWRRLGDSIQVQVSFRNGSGGAASGSGYVEFTLPSGFSVDTTKITTSLAGGYRVQGFGAVSAINKHGPVYFNSATSRFRVLDGSDGDWVTVSDIVASAGFSALFEVPIVGWSSNVTIADRAIEEFGYNSDVTSTATVNASGFAQGAEGVLFSSNWAVGTAYVRRVRFNTPIQATDRIVVEINGTGYWASNESFFPNIQQGSSFYGIAAVPVNATDVDVTFRPNGRIADGATYGANGSSFAALNALNFRWRVRKTSSGAGVGFPISAANLLSGSITNNEVSATAAIAGTKINPDFGSQAVTTTGLLTVGDFVARTASRFYEIGVNTSGTSASLDGYLSYAFRNENNVSVALLRTYLATGGESQLQFLVTPPGARNTFRGAVGLSLSTSASGIYTLLMPDTGGNFTSDPIGNGSIGAIAIGSGASGATINMSGGSSPAIRMNRNNDGQILQFFRYTTGGNQVGSVSVTSASTTYNTTSDYRLKKDVVVMTGALDRIKAIRPVTYKWKIDNSAGEGFIAHEVAEVVPLAITGAKDEVDGDGLPVYQGIDYSKIVPLLTGAVKDLLSQFEGLETRLQALETALT